MEYQIDNIAQEFPEELSSKGKALWNDSLFKASTKSPILDAEKAKLFHSFIIKDIFLVKRARPDLKSGFAFLSTSIKGSIEED